MKFTKLAITFLCSTVLFCGCAKNSDIVLKINDTNITRAEFNQDFEKIRVSQLKNAPKEIQNKNSYASLAIKEKFVNDLIIRTLLEQEFEKRKIEVTDKEIEDKTKELIAQIGSEEEMKNMLKQNNISDERLKKDMASEVKLKKLAATLKIPSVSDSEVEKFYKERKELFTQPERVQASHILISLNANDIRREIVENDKEAKLSTAEIDAKVKEVIAKKEALAKEVQKKAAVNPKNFASLAEQYSEDPGSKSVGGDLGYFDKETMVPEFTKAAFTQKVGVVGPLVKTQFGYHIILVKDKSAALTKSLKDVKADLKVYLAQKKKNETIQKFVDGLKNQSKIEFVDASIDPANIKKEINEAFEKQLKQQAVKGVPKSKQKKLESQK